MTSSEIITTLFETADQLHVFHLQTTSYAEHNALGFIYSAVHDASDAFAETLMGVEGERPMLAGTFKLSDYKAGAPEKYLAAFAEVLEGWTDLSTDLLNMRDDLLAKVHKTQYLLTLK